MITKYATIAGTATKISVRPNRNWFIIRNTGSNPVWLSYEGSSGVTDDSGNYPGDKLAAGEKLYSPSSYNDMGSGRKPIYAIATAQATTTVVIQEG